MKKLLTVALIALMILTAMTAIAEEATTTWAYGAMPLNNGNVGTIYYTAAYYEGEAVASPIK